VAALADGGGGQGEGAAVCLLTASSWQRRGKYENDAYRKPTRMCGKGGREEQRAALLLLPAHSEKQKQTNESTKAENVLERNSTTKSSLFDRA
jgi:hypothetical protein